MKGRAEGRCHSSRQLFALSFVLVILAQITVAKSSSNNQITELLVRKFPESNSGGESLPKILKLTSNGREKVEEPSFTLKSDPVKVQVDFKTVDVSILNKLKDKENADKVAVIQEDLQSRIKIGQGETSSTEPAEVTIPTEPMDPEEVKKRQAEIKEDIESRLLPDNGFLVAIRRDFPQDEKPHYQVKRSDDDYYAEEPVAEESHQSSVTTLPTKEDSFLSIFESLFGSNDDESQTKKKSRPDDGEPIFKETGDEKMRENLKIVGDLLKPLKPIEEPESKKGAKPYLVHPEDEPESRIVNNFQYKNHGYKSSTESKPSHHGSFRPMATDKSFQSHKSHTTDGYEDYDLEEFMDSYNPTTKGKQTPSIVTPSVTTTASVTTVKNSNENKSLTFPSVQKKNEYFNRNRHQVAKNESIERGPEKTNFPPAEMKRTTMTTTTTTTTTTERQYSAYHSQKSNEVKPPKIYESPNFYNLINLPVKYSTKDTAIPLISSSYANTKIQGSSAHKYEKNSSGKYPNHKYDQVNAVVTNGPSYWATKRTEPAATVTHVTSSPTTNEYVPQRVFEKFDYDDAEMISGLEYGGYGAKKEAETKSQDSGETDRRKENVKPFGTKHDAFSEKPDSKRKETGNKEYGTVSEEVEEEPYEGGEYDSDDKHGPIDQSHRTQGNQAQGSQGGNNEYYKETINPGAEPEYEYYDYEFESTTAGTTKKPTTAATTTTTTTTTTTPKSKISYTGYPKEKIKPQAVDERIAVVVPSKSHDFYEEVRPETRKPPTVIMSTVNAGRTSPSTTTSTTTATTTTTTTTTTAKPTEETIRFKKPGNQNVNSAHFPSPTFENREKQGWSTTRATPFLTTATTSAAKPTVEPAANRIADASSDRVRQSGQESNINIVLVPTKETLRNGDKTGEKYSPEELFSRPVHTFQLEPNGLPYPNNRGHGTEVGVQGHAGNHAFPSTGNHAFPSTGNRPPLQGHFVASSIVTSPYEDDEPFRPIPKPAGMTSSFQVVSENVGHQHKQNLGPIIPNQRPVSPPSGSEVKIRETGHEAHKFIPSPQLHRPVQPEPSDSDYDFEGIQIEPKPGQYVIFSKPQLNPELKENQSKKKVESGAKETISNVPHFQNEGSRFPVGNRVAFKPNEEQYQQTGSVQQAVKPEGRPTYLNTAESGGDELALELVPPRETQTEKKPFDGNAIPSESENAENKIRYPRPHWEKNGKPSFLLNSASGQNDDSRLPSLPSQMTPPSLVPSNGIPPQIYRRPVQPFPSAVRKNYNEGSSNVQPKPNLPNILPQFRPNMKIGSRPFHGPSRDRYVNPNRRTSVNRYRGNFPYRIQYPEKDVSSRGEREPEIVPKFITNGANFPGETWNDRGIQKRFGQGPSNDESLTEYNFRPPESFKILRRLQRTPVTTLQMLKQVPEAFPETEASSQNVGSLLPRHYATRPDGPEVEENLYIVYPAKAPQKLHLENVGNVFVVSGAKSWTTHNDASRKPFRESGKKGNDPADEATVESSSGVANTKGEKVEQYDENEGKKTTESRPDGYETDPKSVSGTNDESIDRDFHLQSNNQWNEVKSIQVRKIPGERLTGSDGFLENTAESKVDPPSRYEAAVADDGNSAFTLGTVLLAATGDNSKGQGATASLRGGDSSLHRLLVDGSVADGKTATHAMPSVESGNGNESVPDGQNFEAPFQASLSASESDLRPIGQGWTAVEVPEEKAEVEVRERTTQTTTTRFNFENFTPELIGGFKPIFEMPEEPEKDKAEGMPKGETEDPKTPVAR